MKTLYLKTTMKMLRLLPALIFFILALSYTARSQTVAKTPLCYGEPIQLQCNFPAGCDNMSATFHWENFSGSWTSSERDPVINVGEVGYATDKFYLSMQYAPPPGGFYGGRVSVTVLAPIIITGITSPVVCFGTSSGGVDITVTGGKLPYVYNWSNGFTTQDISGVGAGTYFVTVTDGNACSQVSSAYVVEESSTAVTVTGTATPLSCYGSSNGMIDITPGGGVPGYTYLWSNNSTGQDLSGLSTGTYTVTVTDTKGCTATGSWLVTQPVQLTLTGEPFPVACFGGSNGSIEIDPGGGNSPYTFMWSNSNTNQDITGLTAGWYTVTVTDNTSCTITGSWQVLQPVQLTVSGSASPASCYTSSDGSINITPAGGTSPYTFAWTNGATSEDISGLAPGVYTVTVSDSHSCTATGSFEVTRPSQLLVEGSATDVQCKNGACNGTINITVSGGTSGYTFSWSNAQTTEDVTNLCEGTYTVTVTDSKLCTVVGSWHVGAPTALTVSGVPTNTTCFGYEDGSISITPAGGTPGYTYVWSDPAGSTTQNVSGLIAGTYTVTVTDSHLCTVTGSWTVGQPGEVSWEGSTTNVSCNGVCDGTITETMLIGGTPPYTYFWSNPVSGFTSTNQNLTGLCAGTYYLTVTDAHSCDARPFREITQPAVLAVSPNAVITPALCFNGTGGAIDITVTGGTTLYSYLWSNNATTQDISGLAPGWYTVTVTDAHNCTATGSFEVGSPAQVVVEGIVTDLSCKGGTCNGAIDITVTGGTTNYTYAWSNLATTADITGLCEGTYTVTVTDAHNCVAVGSWIVGAPPALAVTGVPTNTTCFGYEDGSIAITPAGGTPGYTYIWSDPAGSTTQNVSGLIAGTYTVTVTDSHLCTVTGSWTVGQPGEVSWEGSTTNVSCNGVCDGTITETMLIGGTPPYTYFWSNPVSGFTSTNQNLTGLCAGTYYLTVTDAHTCDARPFREITQPAVLAVSPNAVITPALCFNGTGGAIDITVTGGTTLYSYLWSNNATTQDISGLAPGWYTVTVTDAHSCTATGSFEVGSPAQVVVEGIVTDLSCKGGTCNGAIDITVTGGTTNYTYAWSNLATTADITGLCEGTYTVTVTDAHNCVAVGSWIVGAPPALTVTGVPTNTTCFGYEDGSIAITPAGGTPGYTYVWSDPAGSTTQNVSGLTAGTYTVTVTDSHLCTVTGSWTVGQPGEVSWEGSTTNVSCNGVCDGTITETMLIGGTPPYTYFWSNPVSGFTSTDKNLTGLCAGTYYLTVTDAHSCDARPFREITQPAVLAVSPNAVITPALCFNGTGGAIDITVTGGTTLYSYLWSNNATTQDISGLAPGWYTVTVTDAHSCTATGSFEVGSPAEILLSGEPTNMLCKGGDCNGAIYLSVSGGTTDYSFVWSNSATTQNISSLCEGTYTVTVTDAHSCEAVGSWTVGAPPVLAVTGEPTNTSCYGYEDGSITINPTGGTPGYTYVWSDPAGSTTQNVSGLVAGTYTVTVTDSHLCTVTGSWTVGQPGEVSWEGSTTNISCNGVCDGTITQTMLIGGTPPYTYFWSNPATGYTSTDMNLTGLCAGTYYLTVTDAHSCDARPFREITQPAVLAISPNAIITTPLCNGGNGGAIDITVTGGTTLYSYLWSNNATTQDISGLTTGTYTVTVVDAHSCTTSRSFFVDQPTQLEVFGSPTDVICKTDCNGTINTYAIGGTGSYTYTWSDGKSTSYISGLCEGTYTVTVTDANSCEAVGSWSVGAPEQLIIATSHVTDVNCFGDGNGAIDITVSGGTPGYSYLWSNNATTSSISNLISGTYTVTVTDAHQCSLSQTFFVGTPQQLIVTGEPTDALCKRSLDGEIEIDVTGGTPDYTYIWSNGKTTENISGIGEGTYTVTVTDAHSCETTGSWTVHAPDELLIGETLVTNVSCNGASNGFISGGLINNVYQPLIITGGTEPYTYLWSNGFTTSSLCCLGVGCYTVTVTDAHSCEVTGSWCVTQPDPLILDASVTNILCNGASTGAIDLTVTGGTPDYQSYLWSNGATTEDISNLPAGVYTVTVVDAEGCPKSGSWEVTQPTKLVIDPNATITNVLCNGVPIGAIDISVSGGTTPYYYAWSNFATTQDITGLSGGWYTVTVADANSCDASYSWFVAEPTALELSATVTDILCYQTSTGAIDLTVTGGTSPYGYAWSNGQTTQDISGLGGGWYTVTVTDAHSCMISASYEVLQPDPWGVNIEGDATVCCNSPFDAGYTAMVFGQEFEMGRCNIDDITYEWVVVGGTITSGWNTNHITVNWSCCAVGTVTVTATKCDGCQISSTYTVIVNTPPAPVITGSATVFSGTDEQYCVLPAIPGHLYSWTVEGGSYTTVPGSNCITVTWGAYPACGCGKIIVCETDPLTGCVGCDTLYITMLPTPEDIMISGTVAYKNVLPVPSIPLNGVTVQLRNAATNQLIATTVTGPNMNGNGEPGYYAFTNVPAGNYKLEASFNGTWGGNNATDALLVQLQAALEYGPPANWILQGLYHTAGDVNASGYVTALDALYIKLRTVGSINSYPAGNWTFENPVVTIVGTTPVVADFYGLCVGDVNGSYIPTGMKEASFLSVINDETQTVPVEESFAYEIRSNMVAQLGAMTLYMGYDKDRFEVMDVTASSNDEMKYVIEDGKVAIAWADTKPMSVRNNDQILTLNVKAKAPLAEATNIFAVLTGSEFANPNGTRYDNFDLKMSKVITAGGSKEFSITNYPNPFTDNTKIVYSLPESGNVTLVITDMFGKTVRTLVDGFQSAGTYSIAVNAAELNLTSGVYLYRIEAAGATETYVKVNKMVFAH